VLGGLGRAQKYAIFITVYNVYDASSPIQGHCLSGSCVMRATHDTEDTYVVLCAPVIGLSVFLRCVTPLIWFSTKFTVKTVQNHCCHVSTGHPHCLLPAIIQVFPTVPPPSLLNHGI
jgi:hypothetical protein